MWGKIFIGIEYFLLLNLILITIVLDVKYGKVLQALGMLVLEIIIFFGIKKDEKRYLAKKNQKNIKKNKLGSDNNK